MRIQILAAVAIGLVPPMAEARGGSSPVRVMRGSDAGTSWDASRQQHGMRTEHRVGHSGGFNRYPGYRHIRRGGMVPGYWASPRYGISNYGMYGFDRPMSRSRWVRYYDDALLVDHSGRVRDGRYGMDFDRYGEGWEHDDRGVPAYVGDGDYRYDDRDYAWSDRFDRDEYGDLDYDRDYPYEHPYGGYGQMQSGYGYGHGGGYTVTETTVTTGPSVVTYLEPRGVAVHRKKRTMKMKRGYGSSRSAYRAKAVPRCVC